MGISRHPLHILTISLLFLLYFAIPTRAQSCSASSPCEKGCCNEWGFCGLGPDYCGKTCVANCDRKAECDPGNYTAKYVENVKCPLNVCCSKWGFCGLTDEFCGSKKVKAPSCGTSHSLQRVVGYYEGWSRDRDCNVFMPEQIPAGVYTHLNFAFASIDPVSFEIVPASTADAKLYERLTFLKKRDPDLKVFIAIGGWTFNDPGPTATTFSDIARSEANQKAFFKSLISFMATYDFDGIDLDWEYPVAKDRNGRDGDFDNFPRFISNLKKALKSTGGRDGVSLTLPASYWYLQHFDIVKLEPHVDFFNIMTYDLHGTWDRTNEWVGPYLNAHTNLTEIKEAMNLLWRNKIDPDKVVLGMAFYGRAFTATSSSCLKPGCTYESGAPRQACSKEISVMLNSEIVDVQKRTGATAQLDEDAAVKIMTFDGNQWVAYDDEDTFKMKVDFAREQCLNGVMVWAVSHDTEDARYSMALGQAAGRKFTSLSLNLGVLEVDDDGMIKTTTKHSQCKWTNCGENCPANWVRMMRKDKGARKNEFIVDGSACSGCGVHQLCCPPDTELPTCGWYTHHNGKCDPQCPSGTVEVGSNKQYCRSGFQSACCTTGGSNMKLYSQCDWTGWGRCDDESCPSDLDETARSSTGSGGAVCNLRSWPGIHDKGHYTVQERKYCCDDDQDDQKWDDCKWYDNLGPGPSDDDLFCRSGCPSDRVRVAMDQWANNPEDTIACARGARSKCCIPRYATVSKRERSQDSVYRDALVAWLEYPVCSSSYFGVGLKVKRDSGSGGSGNASNDLDHDRRAHGHSHSHLGHSRVFQRALHSHREPAELKARAFSLPNLDPSSFNELEVKDLVQLLLLQLATTYQRQIWDNAVKSDYPNLVWNKLESWLDESGELAKYGYSQLVNLITCQMGLYNDMVRGKKSNPCDCDEETCCYALGNSCNEEIDQTARDLTSASKTLPAVDLAADVDQGSCGTDGNISPEEDSLEGRQAGSAPGDSRPYDFVVDGQAGIIWSVEYDPANTWSSSHEIFQHVYSIPSDCSEMDPVVLRGMAGVAGLNIEHIVEMNTIRTFFEQAGRGELMSGATMRAGRISASFFITSIQTPYISQYRPPDSIGGGFSNLPATRIMNAFGSRSNLYQFVMTTTELNQLKRYVWRIGLDGYGHVETDATMSTFIRSLDSTTEFVRGLRDAIVVISYLRDPYVWQRLTTTFQDIRTELGYAARWHRELTGFDEDVASAWDEFFPDYLDFMVETARNWIEEWIVKAEERYQGSQDPRALQLLSQLGLVRIAARQMSLPTRSLPRLN